MQLFSFNDALDMLSYKMQNFPRLVKLYLELNCAVFMIGELIDELYRRFSELEFGDDAEWVGELELDDATARVGELEL